MPGGKWSLTTTSVRSVAAGFVNGAEIDLLSYMTVRYFGIRHYGRIFG